MKISIEDINKDLKNKGFQISGNFNVIYNDGTIIYRTRNFNEALTQTTRLLSLFNLFKEMGTLGLPNISKIYTKREIATIAKILWLRFQ